MDTVIGVIIIYICSYYGIDRFLRARGHKGEAMSHFDGEKFLNIGDDDKAVTNNRSKFFKWIISRPKNDWKWRENTFKAKPQERVNVGVVITHINHASLLIQVDGLNILTDPIWSKRASPLSWLGPKRYRPAGIAFDDLPPIDVVIISHNHYDHMDLPTLHKLNMKWNPLIYAGLGNKHFLEQKGVRQSNELDWWESVMLGGVVKLMCVPAQHFSSRAISDRNKTLWCGYVIEASVGNIYFAGDTGYGPYLTELKKRYKSFLVGMIPIGAYIPEFFMQPVHMSPKEAYRAAGELGVEHMIPIHYATFHLADDKQDQPVADLAQAQKENPNSSVVHVLENGAAFYFPQST